MNIIKYRIGSQRIKDELEFFTKSIFEIGKL